MSLENIKNLEKSVTSELANKVSKSIISYEELQINIKIDDLIHVINTLKSNEKFKFKQLIDIAGVDNLGNEKRFQIIYLSSPQKQKLKK